VESENDEVREALAQFKPLEARILGMVSNMPVWNYKVVSELFPTEHSKSIYRALNKLEKSGQINCLGWHGRSKQYSTYDVSNLPIFINSNGKQTPMVEWAKYTHTHQYDGTHWRNLQNTLNEFPILVTEMFVVAQRDGDEFLAGYQALIKRLVEMKTAANSVSMWIDVLLNHAIFNDKDTFKALLRKEMLDPQLLNEFKVWLFKTFPKDSKNED
jgi:hypothetical protein